MQIAARLERRRGAELEALWWRWIDPLAGWTFAQRHAARLNDDSGTVRGERRERDHAGIGSLSFESAGELKKASFWGGTKRERPPHTKMCVSPHTIVNPCVPRERVAHASKFCIRSPEKESTVARLESLRARNASPLLVKAIEVTTWRDREQEPRASLSLSLSLSCARVCERGLETSQPPRARPRRHQPRGNLRFRAVVGAYYGSVGLARWAPVNNYYLRVVASRRRTDAAECGGHPEDRVFNARRASTASLGFLPTPRERERERESVLIVERRRGVFGRELFDDPSRPPAGVFFFNDLFRACGFFPSHVETHPASFL